MFRITVRLTFTDSFNSAKNNEKYKHGLSHERVHHTRTEEDSTRRIEIIRGLEASLQGCTGNQ